jgi:hypothetical protein
MRVRRSISGRLDRLRADERGFAVPTVMLMLLAGFAIVGVAVFASVETQSGVVRDQRSKSALTASEAGVSQALLHYNEINPASATPCLVNGAGGLVGAAATQGTGWCAPVSGSGGGGTYQYQVKPTASSGTVEIVSLGTVSGITRRVDVMAKSSSGTQVFGSAAVQSANGIAIESQGLVQASAAAGSSITLGSSAKLCGTSSVGLSGSLTISGSGAYYSDTGCTSVLSSSSVNHQAVTLPPVNQGDVATNNDNARITNAVNGTGTPSDLISGNKADVTWNAAARTLTVNNNSSLTLTGGEYSFCQVTLVKNSSIYIAANVTTRIYFDSPEACNQASGTTQLSVDSNARIAATSGAASSIAMLFVGSQTLATSIVMSSNTSAPLCTQNFILYAPYTDITLRSNSRFCGAMAGKSILLNSNTTVTTDTVSTAFTLPTVAPHYVVNRFVECSSAAQSTPNAGC